MTQLQIPIARYRFQWKVKTPLLLPPYASSTLRGVFGRVLKQQACLTRATHCQGCALAAACSYPQLFEPQNVPRPAESLPALAPYSIETPFTQTTDSAARNHYHPPGTEYTFDMVLMTAAAIQQLGLIISVWKAVFAQGVGPKDGKAELQQVTCLPDSSAPLIVYTAQAPRIQDHSPSLSVPLFSSPTDVLLQLETPLRIVQRGQLIRADDITPGLFLRHLIRRISFQLCHRQAEAFPLGDIHQLNALADQVKAEAQQLQWYDWERNSSRQKQKMKLGGLAGYWLLQDVPEPLLSLIYMGQWFHVGKEISFGLGKYRWLQTETTSATVDHRLLASLPNGDKRHARA